MTSIERIKQELIDTIMISKNEKLLEAVSQIFASSDSTDKLQLDSYQIEMLEMSEKDIQNGDIISEDDLNQSDSEWLT
jgi:archaellum component FlaF (FlaF/FlaG flagellin family)